MESWNPDCLDRCLGFFNGSPKNKAATGYYMLRIIFSVIVVHSGIIFASVITYAALEVTNCTGSSNDDGGACGASDDGGNDDSEQCKRLWGLLKPDSLLTVVGTAAAIFLAVSAAVTGTTMDVTPYRRQIGLFGNVLCTLGMILCLSLVQPTESTLAVAAVGLMLVLIFKDYLNLQIDSYGPELSKDPAEIGTAVTAGFTWALVSEVFLIIVWTVVGMGMSNDLFGFVVSLGSIGMMIVCSIVSYRRLPDVPSAYILPADTNIFRFTFARLRKTATETYYQYPDLGLLLVSAMIFDPALTAVFAAAVLILVSKYHFSASSVTLLLGLAIISAIPAVPLSCWLASTPRLDWLFGHEAVVVMVPEKAHDEQNDPEEATITTQEVILDDHTVLSDENIATLDEHAAAESIDASQIPVEPQIPPRFHPHRVKIFLILGLLLTIANTILVVVILKACQFGLACVFSVTWGFLLSFCWNSLSMLRIALVPGGRESEYAGLYLALYSSMIWLPLFVFSVANEIWNINGAMYVLTIFFGIGAILLACVNIDRALAVRLDSLGRRRWATDTTNASTAGGPEDTSMVSNNDGSSGDGEHIGGSVKNVVNNSA
eukprot:gene13085-15087_t